jgi:gamma-glutamyltranspeptidase/glutathione hydrolase
MKRLSLLIAVLTACTSGESSVSGVGAVSSASPEATAAGIEILRAGGNAVDAAVAVAFTLGVTEPAMSGLGAGIQLLVYHPEVEPRVINGTSFAPAATPRDTAGVGPIVGHRLTTIPTSVRALEFAWREYGSGKISWADLLAPAIRYAEEGFVVGTFRTKVWSRHQKDLAESPSAGPLFLHQDGSPPVEGELWQQPVLARTLRRIAEGGATEFYRGDIAREIAADMAANGGWITFDDLAGLPEPQAQEALHSTYRGYDIFTVAPPASGWVVQQILNLLELSSPESLAAGSAERANRLVEALIIGHTSRRATPIGDMVEYAPEVAERTDKATAARLLDEYRATAEGAGDPERDNGRGETTHFSVADGSGMAVAVTTSINAYFGARVVTPSLGFLYNDYMQEFHFDNPSHPFALRPGGMPSSSMSATVVARDGLAVLAVGSPGSARIISAVSQVIQRWVDGGQDIVASVSAPRLHVVPPSALYIEDPDLALSAGPGFESLGYRVSHPVDDLTLRGLNAYFGGVHAVAWEGGRWVGAADPRRDGVARQP